MEQACIENGQDEDDFFVLKENSYLSTRLPNSTCFTFFFLVTLVLTYIVLFSIFRRGYQLFPFTVADTLARENQRIGTFLLRTPPEFVRLGGCFLLP